MSTTTEVFDDVDVPHTVEYNFESKFTQIQLSRRKLGAHDFRVVVHAARVAHAFDRVIHATVKGGKLYLYLPDPLDPTTIDGVKRTLQQIETRLATYDPNEFTRSSTFDRRTHRRSRAAIEYHRRDRRKVNAALSALTT